MVPYLRPGVRRACLRIGAIAVLTALLTGCAVLFRGTTQVVPIESEPVGAEVFVDGERVGVTPLRVPLARGSAHDVVIRFEGQERRVRLSSNIDETGGLWLLADAVPGGVIVGAAVFAPRTDSLADVILVPVAAAGVGIAAIPMAVDLFTGAAAQLTPTEVFVAFDVDAP